MSVRDRNAARLNRLTERLKTVVPEEDAGTESPNDATPSLSSPAEIVGALSVSEHPALAHTQEITREVVQELRSDLARASAQNVELQAALSQQAAEKSRARLLDPARIKQSRFRDRVEQAFSDRAFVQLKREIKATNGNVEAIKVRPIAGEDGYDFEVVYGHRRHRACLELGLQVRAEIEQLDQRRMLIEMWAENQAREDLSLFEQALSMQRMLDEGVFTSRGELGSHIGMTRSALSKLLAVADVADVAKRVLADPRDLTARIATMLRARINEDSQVIADLTAEVEKTGKMSMKKLRSFLSPAPSSGEGFSFRNGDGVLIDGQRYSDSATLTIHRQLTKEQLGKLAAFVSSL